MTTDRQDHRRPDGRCSHLRGIGRLGRRGQGRPDLHALRPARPVLGEQARDGFLLALDDLGGKLGGLDVETVVVDDELKPDVAVNKAKKLVERDQVDFVVGPIFFEQF